jgi:tetratricopeptide (TPR) repeat protein
MKEIVYIQKIDDLFADLLNSHEDNKALSNNQPEKNEDFFFDDEPMEKILYGKSPDIGPSAANLYLPEKKRMEEIISIFKSCQIKDELMEAVRKVSFLDQSGIHMNIDMSHQLSFYMGELIPLYPNPQLDIDISGLENLLLQMWKASIRSSGLNLIYRIGTMFYRWYEHHGKYREARKIIARLIKHNQKKEENLNAGVLLNNLAFEYMLEQRWKKAIPIFERAQKIFSERGDRYEYANARANYWLCRIECEMPMDFEKVEEECKDLLKILSGETSWHERKPLIILAKIKEKQGKLSQAASLVSRAIKVCKNSKTQYPEMDNTYLSILRKKIIETKKVK